jgi:hypothetical protein
MMLRLLVRWGAINVHRTADTSVHGLQWKDLRGVAEDEAERR